MRELILFCGLKGRRHLGDRLKLRAGGKLTERHRRGLCTRSGAQVEALAFRGVSDSEAGAKEAG